MLQHAGNPAECLVAPGDTVREGMLIGRTAGFISSQVHSLGAGEGPGTPRDLSPERREVQGRRDRLGRRVRPARKEVETFSLGQAFQGRPPRGGGRQGRRGHGRLRLSRPHQADGAEGKKGRGPRPERDGMRALSDRRPPPHDRKTRGNPRGHEDSLEDPFPFPNA